MDTAAATKTSKAAIFGCMELGTTRGPEVACTQFETIR
jgi:hypothetical protein